MFIESPLIGYPTCLLLADADMVRWLTALWTDFNMKEGGDGGQQGEVEAQRF